MEPTRCGLIGYGAWGQHHARAISATPDARLTAIAANSPQSVAKAKQEHPGVAVYGDYRQMLSEQKLDLCDIVLPSYLHHEVSRAVLEAGVNLLLEKPMALKVEDCSDLVRLAREKKLMLAVGHELRMSSLWGRVKSLIDEGAIGDPLYALIELWRKPYRLGSGGWRYDLSRVGDWILEEPIHFFDLARWYMTTAGDPISVHAVGNGKRPDRPELHDNFSAIVRFKGGQYAVVSQTLAAWEHHQVVKLTGTKGAIWASWSGAMDRTFEPTHWLKLQQGDGEPQEVKLDTPSGEVYELVDQLAAVVKALRTGGKPPCTGEDGWWSTAMCLRASESLAKNDTVSLKGP